MASGVSRQRSWFDEGWNSSLSVRAMWLIWLALLRRASCGGAPVADRWSGGFY